MSEEATLVQDKVTRWATEAEGYVKDAKKAASKADLACFEAVATVTQPIPPSFLLFSKSYFD